MILPIRQLPIRKIQILALITAFLILSQLPITAAIAQSAKSPNTHEALYPLIDQELQRAKSDLDQNKVASPEDINSLKTNLDAIWADIRNQGHAENTGFDIDLRPAYITMQGIIESAITEAFKKRLIDSASISIITPHMPTPLMLKAGRGLHEINLNDPQGFAYYRNLILIEFLESGGTINTVYSHDAESLISDHAQTSALENYASYCELYNNLVDCPVIKIDSAQFPPEMTGALYLVDGSPISIESRQVDQIDNQKTQFWSIKFGNKAELRMNELNRFLEDN